MKKCTSVITLVLALAVAAGCGPNGGGNNGGGITAEAFAQQFPQAYAEAACKSAFQCPENQSPVFTTVLFARTPTEADCVEAFTQNPDEFVALGDIESGVIEFDAQAAQTCLDEIEQRSSGNACDIALAGEPVPQSCYQATMGTLADGETCAFDEQCQSGACDETAIQDSCTGQCAPRADEGEECSPSDTGEGAECRPSLTCIPNDAGGFECAPMASLQEGDACVSSFRSLTACSGGLQCDGEGGSDTCKSVAYVAEGEDCTTDLTYCQPGLVCLEGACETAGVDGDPCDGSGFNCQVGFYCDTGTGTDPSVCAPVKQSGDACDSSGQCDANLECIGDSCQQPEACTLTMN